MDRWMNLLKNRQTGIDMDKLGRQTNEQIEKQTAFEFSTPQSYFDFKMFVRKGHDGIAKQGFFCLMKPNTKVKIRKLGKSKQTLDIVSQTYNKKTALFTILQFICNYRMGPIRQSVTLLQA